ncbi:hypothetical protein [Aliterella atlantica]|uniref:Uncharacterized protein n=1 Tax=Aliterella atlantica CENA595 TaxID=1618023 RepID=A0A0D8ZM43_9CYAN|nr:hypothetical protein [Aliterella atlantica]KJH69509.1 hypothetical protein UH38_23425 [Aliterella atlantica CENA595]
MTKTQQDIIRQGYKALVDSLGVVNAIRFMQHFSPGQGDYTQERHQWLERVPLENILVGMSQRREDDETQYDEIIK